VRDVLVLRVAARHQASPRVKHYPIDRGAVRRQLQDLNDPKTQQSTREQHGGYEVFRLEMVPIRDINLPPTWNPDRERRLVEAFRDGKPLPPVRLSREGSRWNVTDGIHRTNLSKLQGFTHVPAIVGEWVETPEAFTQPEQEKPRLPLGAWVKLREPDMGRSYGWVDERLPFRREKGVPRWIYNIALVKPGDASADFVDVMDTEFDPVEPPSWGPDVKALVGKE
jgi:hypothetical protein